MRRGPALVLGAVALITVAWLGRFVFASDRLPPGPDVAWYVWRTEFLATQQPAELIRFEGPLRAFGGGYRVANPIVGGLLRSAGGASPRGVSVLFTAGWSILAALAVGAAAHRYRRDPRLFALAATFAGAMLFRPAFVGFSDSMLSLVLLAGALVLAPDAPGSRAARAGIGLLVGASMFAHLPATWIFLASLVGAALWRALSARSIREALRSDGPALAAAAAGAVVGIAAWRFGIWGVPKALGAALELAPFSREQFAATTARWFGYLLPVVLVPLLVAGIAEIVRGHRDEARAGEPVLGRVALAWTLPVLGAAGALVGIRYPYHRSFNATLGHLLVAGIGLWAIAVALRRWRAIAAIFPLALIAATAWFGIRSYERLAPWVPPEVASASAVAAAQAELHPDAPLIFTVEGDPDAPSDVTFARAFRGTWSRFRAGLPGDVLPRAHMFFGRVEDLLAGRPTRSGGAAYDRLSAATAADVRAATGAREPLIVVAAALNPGARVGPPYRLVPLGGGASAVAGPRLAAVRSIAGSAEPGKPSPLRTGAVLLFVLIVPGFGIARRLGRRPLAELLGLVPALSLAVTVLVVVAVLGIAPGPLDPGRAGAMLVAALLGGLLLAGLLRAGEGRAAQEQEQDEA